ncbi:hypothetical protein [Mesoplasma seiffertii]|uniref:hypothetical protein n=1 Tax=Mesoplasma seiffertii TaxID=28224 RepID=UPI000479D117|nr:hypothetical protein [Mesoplasma seiffertii]
MNNQQQNQSGYGIQQQPSTRKTLYFVAYIFNIIATVIMGIFILPLLWCIPATIASKRAYVECDTPQEISHIGLGIVSLVLVSRIGGILILVATATKSEPVIIFNQQNPDSGFSNDHVFSGSGVDSPNNSNNK